MPRLIRPCVSAAFVLSLCGSLPLLLAADGPADTILEERRERIRAMTETDRDQLEYKFEVYRNLSASDREKYHRLHEAVENNAELRETMLKYTTWLNTLSIWDRDELRREKDPEKRLRLIEEIRSQQLSEQDGASDPRFQGLSAEDMQAVMHIVEESLTLDAERRDRLEKLPPFHRHVAVLMLAIDERGRHSRHPWPSESLLEQMTEILSDSALREQLLEMRPDERRRALVWRIRVNLFRERHEQRKRLQPSEEQLQAFLMQIDPKERIETLQMSPDRAKWSLLEKYHERHNADFVTAEREYKHLRDALTKLHGWPGRGPWQPQRRSSDDDDDDRGRDDRRRDDRGDSHHDRHDSDRKSPSRRDDADDR